MCLERDHFSFQGPWHAPPADVYSTVRNDNKKRHELKCTEELGAKKIVIQLKTREIVETKGEMLSKTSIKNVEVISTAIFNLSIKFYL